MIIRMRTTLIIEDALFRELKKRAVGRRKPAKLPSFAMGRPRVDLPDRDRLYDVLEGR